MAGGSRRIVIEFLGKDKSLSSTADKAGTRMDRLGGRMRKVGKLAALGLAAGAVVAAKGLYDMGKAAMEDQASTALLAKQLKSSAGATKGQIKQTEDWITAQGKALGVTDDELRPALGKLVRATGDVGKAQKLAALAMNVSAGTGKDLGSVSAALAKAQNGNVSGLSRLGIATKNADGSTKSLAQVTKELGKQFGGAATTKANTLQGKIGRLKLMLSETGEAIGYKLLPVVTKMADWFLNKAVPAISKFSTEIRAKLGPVIEWVRGLFNRNTNSMSGDVSRNFAAIKSTISSVVSIVTSLWNRFGGTIMATAKVAFNAIRSIIGGQFQIIAGIFKVFASLLKGDWRGVWNGIKQILRGAWSVISGVVRLGWAALKAAFRIGASAIKGIFSGLWNGLKGLARAGLNGLVAQFRAIPGRLRALGGLMKSAGKNVLTSILRGLAGAGGFAGDFAARIWGAVKGAINSGIDRLNNLLDFSVEVGPKRLHVSAPNIGHLAMGTNDWRGGPVEVGENGPEILNLPRGSKVTPNHKALQRVSRNGGGNTYITVTGALDPDSVAKQIETMLTKRRRVKGAPLAFVG